MLAFSPQSPKLKYGLYFMLPRKKFLNIVWSGLEPKDLTSTAVGTKTSNFISFRTTGCYVQVLSNAVEK